MRTGQFNPAARNHDFRLAGLVAAGLSRRLGSGSGRASRES
jgi:hypothetical protein